MCFLLLEHENYIQRKRLCQLGRWTRDTNNGRKWITLLIQYIVLSWYTPTFSHFYSDKVFKTLDYNSPNCRDLMLILIPIVKEDILDMDNKLYKLIILQQAGPE